MAICDETDWPLVERVTVRIGELPLHVVYNYCVLVLHSSTGELLPPFTAVSCCLLSARKVRRHLCRAKLQVTLHVLPHYSNGTYMCSLFVHVAGGFFPCSARTNLRAG